MKNEQSFGKIIYIKNSIFKIKEEFVFLLPHPISCAEINSLCKVVALVEAAVVGPGKGNHKLPGTLIGPVHLRRGIYM